MTHFTSIFAMLLMILAVSGQVVRLEYELAPGGVEDDDAVWCFDDCEVVGGEHEQLNEKYLVDI